MGIKKYIETPEKMLELFEAYVKDCKSKPIRKHDFKGKDATPVYYELEAPLTFEGFQNFVSDIPGMPWTLEQYFENRDGRYEAFVGICRTIKRKIREDQIKGGMAGIYNPSITQRLNGLVERKEIKTEEIKPIKLIDASNDSPDA